MAGKIANSYVNASKTYLVDRLLPLKSTSVGWELAPASGSLTEPSHQVPLVSWTGTSASTSTILLNAKDNKPGERQFVSSAGDGLSPAMAVKLGYKTGSNIYGFSTLAPEKMDNIPGWAQVVVSVEELYRASRITKIVPGESGGADSYECYGETGHLPIQGWLCVRVPKHVAVSEEMINSYLADLLSVVTTKGSTAGSSWTANLMDLVRGDTNPA